MKKKILNLILVALMMFGAMFTLTGCGEKKSSFEYTENMKKMRSYSAGYIDNKTIGEILDVAIVDAKWEEDKNEKIMVTGKDKNTNKSVELVWETKYDTMSADNGFESFKLDGTKKTYADFLDYLKEYVNDDNKSSSSDNK